MRNTATFKVTADMRPFFREVTHIATMTFSDWAVFTKHIRGSHYEEALLYLVKAKNWPRDKAEQTVARQAGKQGGLGVKR